MSGEPRDLRGIVAAVEEKSARAMGAVLCPEGHHDEITDTFRPRCPSCGAQV